MRKYILAIGPLSALAVAAACGGSSSGGGTTGGTPVDVDTFASEFCNLLEPCCADAGLSTNGQACQALIKLVGSQGMYNAMAGGACIAALQQQASNPDFCTTGGAGGSSSCSGVFQKPGNVQPGGLCMMDSDCAPAPQGRSQCFVQFQFVDGGTAQMGTCEVQIQTSMTGASPCIGTYSSMGAVTITDYNWGNGAPPATAYLCSANDGIHCDSQSHACVAASPVGGACSTDTDCVSGAYCGFMGGQSQCIARAALGATCTDSSSCVTGGYCDSTGHCAPQLASGTPCTIDQECQSNSCINGACGQGGGNFGFTLICGK